MLGAVRAIYDEQQLLGRGVYGAAFLVKDRADGLRYVVKHVSLDGLDEEDIESAVNEVAALHAMNHPNIVRCHGSWVMPASDDPSLRPWSAGTETTRLPVSEALAVWTAAQANDACVGSVPSLNILTEYVDGGALDKLILQNKGEKPLEEELVGIWLAQLALAIDHMHKNNLLHRDIKPANVFITKSGLVKLGDLGCCKMLQRPDEATTNEYGSPQYLSPEVWQHGICSHKSDIWSIGCVAYELLSFVPPFKEPSLLNKVLTAHAAPLPPHYSAGMRDLVFRALHKDPSQRPGSTELLEDAAIAHHLKKWLAAAHSPLGVM